MKAVVDASALLDALDHGKPECMVALHDLRRTHEFVSPMLLSSELGQVVHRKRPQRFGRDDRDRGLVLEAALEPFRLLASDPLHRALAAAIAARRGLSFYDAEYIAAAVAEGGALLVTQDAALRKAAALELGPDCATDLQQWRMRGRGRAPGAA